eukprot:883395-Rhodomonas_salina.1
MSQLRCAYPSLRCAPPRPEARVPACDARVRGCDTRETHPRRPCSLPLPLAVAVVRAESCRRCACVCAGRHVLQR